ncbi:nudix hydrolase 3-like [Populus alba]|uniref:nudix hydrolase 3-like n=1 Tax=Populus alba TaxID=43335 RepID=UPI003CC706EE
MEITTEQFTCGCTPKARKLLLQRRADCKDSWPDQWYISSAGHISAGDSSLVSAQRELQEELGISLPKYAFELIFIYLQECVINDGKFINNEFNDVYLVTTVDPIPLEAFTLQETEVSAVKYISFKEYRSLLVKEDPDYVPYDVDEQYGHLFEIIRRRYTKQYQNTVACSLSLQKQLCRYASVSLDAELTGLSNTDRKTLGLLIKAAKLMDEIFYLQVWYSNPALRDWLKEHASASELDKLKWMYYSINKSPWSCLDENEAFLTTTDSAIKLLPEATKPVSGWKGLEYKAAFPMLKPPGANFYPPDMDKKEFKLWNDSLTEKEQNDAMGFFTIIKRHSEFSLDSSSPNHAVHGTNHLMTAHDLYNVPYSKEYNSFLRKAAELLHEAGDLAGSPSLKRLLHSKADAFLSNDLVSMQNTLTFQKTLKSFCFGYMVIRMTSSAWYFFSPFHQHSSLR